MLPRVVINEFCEVRKGAESCAGVRMALWVSLWSSAVLLWLKQQMLRLLNAARLLTEIPKPAVSMGVHLDAYDGMGLPCRADCKSVNRDITLRIVAF